MTTSKLFLCQGDLAWRLTLSSARHARELGLDKDDYRKKRFELTCYFDDHFLDGAAAQRPIGKLTDVHASKYPDIT